MAGMDQIVPAMENIKQASEQNVTGVRQTQTAAHNLNELGQNLKTVIEKFKF
jgi:methyl-accepting chemotaxis protein